MSYRNQGYKYKGHSSPDSLQLMARYVGISALIWALLSIGCFFFLTDLRITDQFRMDAFANFAAARSTLLNAAGLVLTSAIVGGLAAAPALVALFALQPRIDTMQRKSGKSKRLSLLLLKQIPTVVLLCTEFLLLSLGLGTAPQLPRSWTEKPNLVSDWSVFIYELFFYPLDNDHVASHWKEALSASGGLQTLNVYLPASLFAEQGSFPKLKKAVGDAQPFFSTAPTVPALLAQVTLGQSAVEEKYLSPLVGKTEILATHLEPSDLGFGAASGTAKASYFLRSEWHAIENEAWNKRGKSGFQWDRHEAIRVRLAQSQFPLFLFFRLGLMSFAHDNWQWRFIANDDSQNLEKFIDQMVAGKDENFQIQNLQLAELEHHPHYVRSPFAPLDWPSTILPQERRWLEAKLDTALSVGLEQIKSRKELSVFVMPFPEQGWQSPFSHAYYKPAKGTNADLHLVRESSQQWITPADIYATGLKQGNVLGETIAIGSSQVQCLPLLLNPDSLTAKKLIHSDALQVAMWEVVRESSGDKFEYPESFSFLPLSQLEPMAFCREFSISANTPTLTTASKSDESLAPSAEKAWLFRMKPENALLENLGDVTPGMDSLAQALLREAALEKIEKKSEKKVERFVSVKKIAARRVRELQARQSREVSMFDAWEVTLKEQNNTVARMILDEEKYALLEQFEPALKRLFEKTAREQLK